MKQVFALFAIIFILAIGILIAQKYLQNRDFNDYIGTKTDNDTLSKMPTATINGHTFDVEVAKTQQEKEIGLSAKKTLDQNAGMLFPFESPAYYPFWMKDMKFSIDIIFIRNGRIVTIHENVKPPTNPSENLHIYNSKEPANAVLEINAGLSKKYKFKKGDLITLKNL